VGRTIPFEHFHEDAIQKKVHRVEGTAVFMTATPQATPSALIHQLKHNRVLHRQVVLLSVLTSDVPSVPNDERLAFEDLGDGFYRLVARYGFMQTPDVPELLRVAGVRFGLQAPVGTTSYFLGRETLLVGRASRVPRWRKALFAFLWRNAQPATAYYHLPPGRVVELGSQIEL
jgi:KUP system potassium uptake protein